MTDPYVGTVFAGRFRVERPLAEGGMGAVYVAVQEPAGRRVALKVIKDVAKAGADLVARFEREMAVLSQLNHPNIVTMYDCGVHAGTLFVVMELMSGHALRDEIEHGRRIDWPRAIRLARDVARALLAVHAQGVVHRDLKPENIFVCQTAGHQDLVKLLDFGIVRHDNEAAPRLTMTGGFIGTPGYISPEQLQGQVATARSDLYALGVILYEMLTGTFPFEAPTIQAMAVKQLVDPVPRVSQAAPDAGVPSDLDALVHRLMSRDPKERPADALSVLDAFEAVLSQSRATPSGPLLVSQLAQTAPPITPSSARTDSLPPTAPTEAGQLPPAHSLPGPSLRASPRRRWSLAAAASVVAVLAMGTAIYGISGSTPTPTTPTPPPITPPITPPPTPPTATPAPPPRAVPDGFVVVAGARFTRGAAKPRNGVERPAQSVAVGDFALMKTEVSTEEFQKWIDVTKPGVVLPGAKKQPVVRVAPDVAERYCAWRVAGGRLPSEDEWELAARSDKSWLFPWGDSPNPSCVRGGAAGTPVDVDALECSGNAQGVLHLVGNVWEWTSDAPSAPSLSGYRIARGGSFATPLSMLDANARAVTKGPDDKTGFRCAAAW